MDQPCIKLLFNEAYKKIFMIEFVKILTFTLFEVLIKVCFMSSGYILNLLYVV